MHASRATHQTTLITLAPSILYAPVFVSSLSDPQLLRNWPGSVLMFATFFAFLADFTRNIPRVKATGKRPFFQLVSRAYLAPHQFRFLTVHSVHPCSRRCASFNPLLPAVKAARSGEQPHYPKGKHTDIQTDRQTDRGSLLKQYSRGWHCISHCLVSKSQIQLPQRVSGGIRTDDLRMRCSEYDMSGENIVIVCPSGTVSFTIQSDQLFWRKMQKNQITCHVP